MASKPVDYQALAAELEIITTELQRDDIDVDVALKHYERGLEVVKQMEAYLEKAENKITNLKAAFASD